MTDELRSPAPLSDPVIGLAEVWKDADYPAPTDVTAALAQGVLRLSAPSDKAASGYVRGLEELVAWARSEGRYYLAEEIRALAAQSAAPMNQQERNDFEEYAFGSPAESSAPSAPCVVVPREPTPEMMMAAFQAFYGSDQTTREQLAMMIYRAMLSAAPAAQPHVVGGKIVGYTLKNCPPVAPSAKTPPIDQHLLNDLEQVADALDVSLGDTDITHIEDDEVLREEHPVQWACSRLNRVIQDLSALTETGEQLPPGYTLLADYIAEQEKIPERTAALDKARAWVKANKGDWIAPARAEEAPQSEVEHLRMQIGYIVTELMVRGDPRSLPEIVETAAKATALHPGPEGKR